MRFSSSVDGHRSVHQDAVALDGHQVDRDGPGCGQGQGLAGTAFRENRSVLTQDYLDCERTKHWHDAAIAYGWGASASFPITEGGRPVAVLAVYRAEVDGFDAEIVSLFERLCADISHAVTEISGTEERRRLQEALAFQQFGLNNADEEIFWIDSDARICEVNATAFQVLGYTRDEMLGLSVFDIDPSMTPEKWPAHWLALQQQKKLCFETVQRKRDGVVFPVEVVTNYFEFGGKGYNCALARNIEERKRTERALAESEERFNLFMDTLPAAAFIKEEDGTTVFINRYLAEIVGSQHWKWKSTRELFPPETAERMIADDRRAIEAGYLVIEDHLPGSDGQIRTFQTHKFRIPRQDQPSLLGGISIDITEQKQMEEKVWNLAFFDPLTNLPNRRMLVDRLGQALVRARRYRASLAVMFLDLDRFKSVNDVCGHDVGDELLKQVAVRLRDCVRNGDTVSRHGGDEFIILLAEIAQPEDAALVAEKVIAAVAQPIEIPPHTLNISTSIGIAVYPVNGGDDVQELLKKADIAMYEAKEAGRSRYRFFPATKGV